MPENIPNPAFLFFADDFPEHSIPFNLWRACHWYNKPVKRANRPSKEDYAYYFKHNISITTSGFYSTSGLKFCVDELGVDRCLFSIGMCFPVFFLFDFPFSEATRNFGVRRGQDR